MIHTTLNEPLFIIPSQHDYFMSIITLSTTAVLLVSISRNCYRFNMAENSENMRGAALMTGSMVGFTVNDAFMKALSSDIPLFQALLLRGLGTVVFLVVLAILRKQFRFDFKSKDWVLIVLRCLAEVMGTVFFLTALFHMPIANVTAVLQALPLTVALAGVVFLREPVGWRRLLAILVGLVGVVLIVRPGGDGFTVYSVYALGAVACITLRDLVVRRMSHDIPSIIVGLMAAIAVTLAGAVIFGASGCNCASSGGLDLKNAIPMRFDGATEDNYWLNIAVGAGPVPPWPDTAGKVGDAYWFASFYLEQD